MAKRNLVGIGGKKPKMIKVIGKSTDVIFRKYKKGGDIIALFPYMVENGRGDVMSYEKIGQHAGANYDAVMTMTKPATKTQYKPLAVELTQIGYKLKVIKRRNYDKFLKAYRKRL